MNVTIQKTAKPIKAKILLGGLLTPFGFIGLITACIHEQPIGILVGAALTISGAALMLVGQAQRWWHHG